MPIRADFNVSESAIKTFGLRNEEGWEGPFTRKEAEGALPNGTRVEVLWSESEPLEQGDQGVILGSIGGVGYATTMYFVEFDKLPKHAVLTNNDKLRVVKQDG